METCDRDPTDWTWYLTLGGKNLLECTGNVYLSVFVAILCIFIVAGYLIIAHSWYKSEMKCTSSKAIQALRDLRIVFIFCALCGYAFFIIKLFYPLWTVYIASLILLVYYTWKYVFQLKDLDIVYKDISELDKIKIEYSKVVEEETVSQRVERILKSLDTCLGKSRE